MKLFILVISLLALTVAVMIPSSMNSGGEIVMEEKLALIIVSGHNGYSNMELDKAAAFRDYLIENLYQSDQIRYLTSIERAGSDGEATIENVDSAFEWLRNTADPQCEVTVYISDHAQIIDNLPTFQFNDGNISGETIDDWLYLIDCQFIKIVVNGQKSGLVGAELSSIDRSVLCSMRSYQDYNPDAFNITRSLKNMDADQNLDGIVSFEEAFEREVSLLRDSGQSPIKFI
jgi:hypothetical protein